jgi:hypothetical protein
MNVELSKMDKDTDKQERRERIKEFGYNSEYERGKAGVHEERKYKRKKNDGEIQMWKRGEKKQRGKKV